MRMLINTINIILLYTNLMLIVILISTNTKILIAQNIEDNKTKKVINIYDLPFEEDINKKNEQIDKKETLNIKVEDIIETTSEYHYGSYRKSDPFEPPIIENVSSTKTSSYIYEIPVVSPLQDDISKLSVKGIWEQKDGTKKALIQTADGQGVIAKIGDPIGPLGKIIEINDKGVLTRQFKIKPDGTKEYEDILLPIGDSKKDTPHKIIIEPGKAPMKVNSEPLKN